MDEERRVVYRVSELSGSEGDLEGVISKRRRKGELIGEGEVVKWVSQICIGLVQMHS